MRKIIYRKIPLLAFFACGMLLSLQLSAQKVNMQFQGTVKDAIEFLQKRYNYSVVIKTQDVDLKKKVNINAVDQEIEKVVADIFASQNITYTINGHNILVSEKGITQSDRSVLSKDITLTGQVIDQEGIPIIGATIYDKKTQNGTVTDANGFYTLQVPENAQITVSYIGYEIINIDVNKRTNINVTLYEKFVDIDEVVVIGYGTQRKSDLTGAVSQINMKVNETRQAISIGDYLRGSIAGLNIQRSASLSGQTTLEVRGQNSLGTSSSPLIVVDGMIYKGSLNDINPNDIETVSVMKDASSAAAYGADGSSGVIILTTKLGKTEKPVIRFDVKSSIEILTRKPEYYDKDGYLAMRADKINGEGAITTTMPEYFTNPYKLRNVSLDAWMAYTNAGQFSDPTDIWLNRLALRPNEIQNYYNYRTIDWVDEVFRTGVIQDYNVSVSGKSSNLNYYWSAGYLDHKGVVVNNNYKNIRSRINVSNNVTDFLEVGIRGNLSSSNSDGQPVDWAVAYDNSPLGDMYEPDGTYTWYPNGDNMAKNPFEKLHWDVYSRTLNLVGSFYTKVTLPYGFMYEGNFNNRWQFRSNNSFRPSWSLDGAKAGGVAERAERKQYDWSLDNILRWKKTIAKIHRFDLVLLQSAAKWMQYSTTGGASKFDTSEVLGWNSLDLGEILTSSSDDQVDTKASYMGRIDYSLMDKYLLTLTFRRDGFSAFGQDNPWANFPAAAVAWRLSEEQFLRGIDWMSNLKLRFSYGKNGNSNIGRYSALPGLANDFYLNADKENIVTLYPTSMGNSMLQWEETLASNLGIELGMFKNKLNLTVELYQSETTNMLMDRTLPTLTGYSKVKSNLGQVNSKGLEITINSVNFNTKNFKWNSDFIFYLNRNEIRHLYGENVDILDSEGNIIGSREADDPTNGWYIGRAIDAIYGYKVIGVWQLDERAEATTLGRSPGDYKTYITEGNTSYSRDDYKWQGFTKPRYRMSLNNTITLFKNIYITFMLRSELGHKKSSNEICVGSYADRVSQMKYPYWTPDNPSNYWGKLGAARTGTLYRDASFLRLEHFNAAYTLPARWTKPLAIENTRIFCNIDNACSFDSWLYWDVETKSPLPTTFTFGLNITL